MTTYEDDRDEWERQHLTIGVAATDRFMSGWGGAAGGQSVACWACHPDDADRVFNWVKRRSEMSRVRFVTLKGWRPKAAHTHVYVVHDEHPALDHRPSNAAIVREHYATAVQG